VNDLDHVEKTMLDALSAVSTQTAAFLTASR
jgi:hypothetical protein